MLHSETLGHGPQLVLLHGWGMNSAVWEDAVTGLATDFQVTLIDLPGHGRSPWNNTELNLTTWVQECLAVAPPRAMWIGWSLGGTIATAAALYAPQRVQALALITSTPRFLRSENWPHGLPETTLTKFRHSLNTHWNETLGNFLTLQVRGSDRALQVLRALQRRLAESPSPNPLALEIGLDLLRDTDLCNELITLQLPSLWIYGERDTLAKARSAESLQQLLPKAQIAIIPGAAHAPFISHRDEVLTLLRSFASAHL